MYRFTFLFYNRFSWFSRCHRRLSIFVFSFWIVSIGKYIFLSPIMVVCGGKFCKFLLFSFDEISARYSVDTRHSSTSLCCTVTCCSWEICFSSTWNSSKSTRIFFFLVRLLSLVILFHSVSFSSQCFQHVNRKEWWSRWIFRTFWLHLLAGSQANSCNFNEEWKINFDFVFSLTFNIILPRIESRQLNRVRVPAWALNWWKRRKKCKFSFLQFEFSAFQSVLPQPSVGVSPLLFINFVDNDNAETQLNGEKTGKILSFPSN